MKVVAEFWPPNALDRLSAWKAEHSDLVAELPAEAVLFDIGRAAPSGTYACVCVDEEYADSFRHELEDRRSVR